MSHDKLGTAAFRSVDQDALFEPILTWGLSPVGYILLVIVFIQEKNGFDPALLRSDRNTIVSVEGNISIYNVIAPI